MPHTYALLVGIDEYPKDTVRHLSGCVNDITAIRDYLNHRVLIDQDRQLHLKILKNEEATRQAIIDGFRQHLRQAQKDDVVLFYYCGHGSQEKAPEEFSDFGLVKLDGLNETLVCYDSRSKGQDCWDLADKELAYLIAEVSKNNPHICIILDSCHSGSGTRDPLQQTGVRLASTDKRNRPLNSYIFQEEELQQLSTSRSLQEHPSGWQILNGSHVLLAACQNSQKAKEISRKNEKRGEYEQRGAFSYYLLKTLQQAKGNLTYRDLLGEAKNLVSTQVTNQSPQLEGNYSEAENQYFLSGAIAKRTPYFRVRHDQTSGWVIDGGNVLGVQGPSGDETTLLALFPFDSDPENLRYSSNSIGTASVTEVLPSLSKVDISGIKDLAPEQTFKAVVTSLPLPPLGVYFKGDKEGVDLARNAIEQMPPENKASVYVFEVQNKDSKEIRYRLLCRNNQYVIARPQDDRPLVAQIDGYTLENAQKVIQRLEHIARWEVIAELQSSGNGLIKLDDVQMEFIFRNEKYNESFQQLKDVRVEYKETDGKTTDRGFQLKLTNNSNQTLYCALLDLGGLFDITNLTNCFFGAGTVKLEPNETAWALNREYIITEVPDQLWEEKITEYADIFKLIVSTSEFDASLLNQKELDVSRTRDIDRGLINRSTLNRLMNRIQDRVAKPEKSELLEDWLTKQVIITTVRPLDTIPVSNTHSTNLGSGVKLHPHALKAKARLTTVPQASRDSGNPILPPILREDPHVTQVFQFTSSRGTDPGLSVLELTDVANPKVVTRDNPLTLLTDVPLREGEHLLPIAYDGEFYLPLGYGKTITDREGNRQTEIKLERLSTPHSRNRDLIGSIKMCFVKVIGDTLGREFDGYHLRAVKVAEDETVTPVENIPARVEQADRILLYVHGIIGDTKDMVKSVQRAKVSVDGQERPLNELYDLVLTFDYENINTDIPEIARQLKKKLAEVGLTADCGKALHVIAHSMGGLVSRWLIEREGGNEIVKYLVMLGTPNAGSPWSTVQDLATLALGIGLNSLSTVAWPVKVLGSLIGGIDAVDITLDQMKPNSEFLRNLAASPDPNIPYSVIAGNTSIMRTAMEEERNQESRLKRLIERLRTQIVEFPFLGQSNDIAVTVKSIKGIPEGRMIPPNIQEVACDHLTYFVENSEALNNLSEYLTQNQ